MVVVVEGASDDETKVDSVFRTVTVELAGGTSVET
jgi:hypothetical protein